jgi:excisionase family DNA binding protein
MSQKRDFTPKEAASELGCHVDFVRKEIKLRRIYPVFRVNARVIRIPAAAVEKYRAARMA